MQQEEKKLDSFDDFTNLYELSKTLRFELKPVGKTQKILEENHIFEKDKLINEKYKLTKPYFDRLHREFVKNSLDNAILTGLDDYQRVLKEWQKNKKDKNAVKKLEKEENKLRNEIVELFNKKAKEYAENFSFLKNKDVGIFFEEGIFAVLKKKYGDEEETKILDEKSGKMVSIFDEWKGFTGYFAKFYETRKNFYDTGDKSTAIAHRIINQNLRRFCENLELFEKIKNKIDFSEAENNFNILINEIFKLDYYNKYLLQDGIDFYNKIIGGETLKNGEKKKGINELINQHRQNNKNEKFPFLKTLDKQILSEKDKNFSIGIETKDELSDKLKEFYKNSEEKIGFLRTLIADFTEHEEKYEAGLNHVYICKEAFNTISYKWTGETHLFEQKLCEAMELDKVKIKKEDNGYKFPNFISLQYIKTALNNIDSVGNFWKEKYYNKSEDQAEILKDEKTLWQQFLKILNFEFKSLFKKEMHNENGEKGEIIGYEIFKDRFCGLINSDNLSLDKDAKVIIKDFADSVKLIYQMGKYFAIEKKRNWDDNYQLDDFYTNPEFGYLKFYEGAYEQLVRVIINPRSRTVC